MDSIKSGSKGMVLCEEIKIIKTIPVLDLQVAEYSCAVNTLLSKQCLVVMRSEVYFTLSVLMGLGHVMPSGLRLSNGRD